MYVCMMYIPTYAQCLNGNAELGNFTNWQGATSIRTATGIKIDQMINGIVAPFHTVTSQGFDPIVGGSLLSMVGEGSHSFKIGDNLGNQHGDRLSYTFTVTNSNASFGFMYAMVMRDGSHKPVENAFFSYTIQRGNNPNIISFNGPNKIIQSKQFIADLNNPFFKKRGDIVWKDWSVECIDLSRYIGETVTISFYAADCAYSNGHFGYAYIDGLCSDLSPVPSFTLPSSVCYSNDIIMDATNSQNEDSYFISVQESDQWWGRYGTEYTEWRIAQKAGVINLKDFIQSQGGAFKCNTYYRVKLSVSNNCNNWKELTKLIYIHCPQMNNIPDVFNCCSETNSYKYVSLGPVTTNSNSIVNWQPSSGVYLFGSNGANAGFFYNQNGYVDVSVTDVSISFPPLSISSCTISQRVNLLLQDDFTLEIDTNRVECCSMILTAKVKFKSVCNKWESLSKEVQNSLLNSLNYTWSTGEKTPSITVSGKSKEYTVTVSSKCKTYSKSYFYHQSPAYWENGQYNEVLQVNSDFIMPGTQIYKKIIIIGSYQDAIGTYYPQIGTTKGIYRSDGIRLRIFNRWGENFRTITFNDCGSLYQGDITWDGTDDNGKYVQDGTYVYKLEIKICGRNWTPYCELSSNIINTNPCLKECWGHIPGRPWWVFGKYCCQRWEGEPCVNSVSIIR